jgi:hypothetical protein
MPIDVRYEKATVIRETKGVTTDLNIIIKMMRMNKTVSMALFSTPDTEAVR